MDRATSFRASQLALAAADNITIASSYSARGQARQAADYTRLAREALAQAIEIIDGAEEPPTSFFAVACAISGVAA